MSDTRSQSSTATVRISAISFLNAVPLSYRFHYGPIPDWMEVAFQPPAQGADALRAGRTDVALLPSIEFQRIPNLVIPANMGIVSPQRVRSVILVSRRPMEELDHIALTVHSRTSVALLKVIMTHFLGRECSYTPFESLHLALERHQAALIIGDAAMQHDFGGMRIYDLAEVWHTHTGLPFVFALWAVRREAFSPRLSDYLRQSKIEGLSHIPRIAADFSRRLNLPEKDIREYLTGNLAFDVGDRERQALRLFYELNHQIGNLSTIEPLEFIDD